ncbi:2796_t:CDS:2 [Ambispora gerdemannii]|uniref:pH-response regulator protein palC n=1 Tax=Ambispora gerdemannii TaxID=144530 RepID=A0A9N8ZPM4_9GLOM|nr:2796_t:CDS:2 [Ambispora gerdemannii]
MSFVYPLPTTGSISFADYLLDTDNKYLNDISEATALRGRVRAVLKESARTEGPKDYTNIMKTVDDYLPYLFAIVDCIEGGQLKLKKEFEASWRCSLSDSVLKKKPRVICRDIYYELIFTLLTYGFACSDWASSIVQRQESDTKLKQAADLLCRAAGIFAFIAEQVCPRWNNPPASRPPDVLIEMATSISKIALADASSIAIRKALMSQTSSSLLAKLSIGVAGHYEKANGLIKSLKDPQKVCGDFRKYVSYGALFHQALGKKFLAKDAYEHQETGKAVGFIRDAKEALHQLSKSKSTIIASRASQEHAEVVGLYTNYVKTNETIAFENVPTKEDLQALIPGGRVALDLTRYTPPVPRFGPGLENIDNKEDDNYILKGRYY